MHYKMKANPLHGAASMNGQKRSKSSKPLRTWTPFLRFQIATGRPSLQSLDLVIQSHDIHFKSIGSMDFFKKPSHLCFCLPPQKIWHLHSIVRQMVAPVWAFIQWPFWVVQRAWGNSSFKTTCRWVNMNSTWDVETLRFGGEAPWSWFGREVLS